MKVVNEGRNEGKTKKLLNDVDWLLRMGHVHVVAVGDFSL